jgi:hypothetical protein
MDEIWIRHLIQKKNALQALAPHFMQLSQQQKLRKVYFILIFD